MATKQNTAKSGDIRYWASKAAQLELQRDELVEALRCFVNVCDHAAECEKASAVLAKVQS